MTGKTIIVVLALLAGATVGALAQSQRNYGADGPGSYGCYGSFSTGTVASRCPGTPGGPQWGSQWQPRPQWQQPWHPQQWQPQPWQR